MLVSSCQSAEQITGPQTSDSIYIIDQSVINEASRTEQDNQRMFTKFTTCKIFRKIVNSGQRALVLFLSLHLYCLLRPRVFPGH